MLKIKGGSLIAELLQTLKEGVALILFGRRKESSSSLRHHSSQTTSRGLPLRKITIGLIVVSAFACTFSLPGQTVPQDLFNNLKWRLIGPFRGGRTVAVAGIAGDPVTYYFGAVNGGIWKTTDAGAVWAPIFDGQPVASIGALGVAPSDPKTIYVGTGESDIRSSLSFGDGVYKSTDAGRTWVHLGLDNTRHISRIAVDPRDANTVYVGALGHVYASDDARGVYKSIDGGTHWTKVFDQGANIGVSDLAICSGDPNVLFAGTWQTRRPPWSTYAPIDGPGGGLFRTQDGGKNWSLLSGSGLPDGDWGRVGVAVAADCKRIYAIIKAKKSGLYRSDDGGNKWTLANDDPRLTNRAWYFNSVTIDPNNRDVIYVPNVALYRSEDAGKTITVVRGAPGGDDYHQLWIDPQNSAHMILGTDQGATISLDGGQTWSTWYNQPTAQMYHVITDNQFPYTVYGTQQDSGSAAVPSRTDAGQITPRDWFPTGESESGYIALDPDHPEIVLLSSAYGGVQRYNRRTGLSQDVTPWPAFIYETEINVRKYRAPWSPVLVISPADPRTLFLGTQFVMRTTDGGLHWETISPDLTGVSSSRREQSTQVSPTNEQAKAQGFGVLSTIAPSRVDGRLIWAGSDTGLVHLSRDAGKTWANVTPAGLSAWSEISLIEASPFDAATAYAAVDRSRLDDQKPHLYRTHDQGVHWQEIVEGIPDRAFLRAIREDPVRRGLLFAGTELGVYVSFDDGDHWQPLQLNLPATSVRDLTIHGDDLIAATHGRSFWILDDINPLRQVTDAANAKSAWLYRPETAVRVDNDEFIGTPLPPEEPTAENPPNGAILDYQLKVAANDVTLEILDSQNRLVRKFSSRDFTASKHLLLPVAERWLPKPLVLSTTPGAHRFVWDLRWGSSGGPIADEEATFHNPAGPKAVPGSYTVRLTVDGQTQIQPLQIVMDPRSAATAAVLEAQLRLGNQIFLETLDARRALAEMTAIKKQISDLLESNQSGAAKTALELAESDVSHILSGDPAQSGQLGMEAAYKNLATALRVVERGDRATPSQAIAVYTESSALVKRRMSDWNSYKNEKFRELNEELKRVGIPEVAVSEIEKAVEDFNTR